jgi:hypothetical protein
MEVGISEARLCRRYQWLAWVVGRGSDGLVRQWLPKEMNKILEGKRSGLEGTNTKCMHRMTWTQDVLCGGPADVA